MPQLYIANATKQKIRLSYWPLQPIVPGVQRTGLVTQEIDIGGQIRVAPRGNEPDLSIDEIDWILDQHRKYGLVPIDDVESCERPFLCYSIGDRPIPPERVHYAMRRNEYALEEQGRKIRKEAALAVNNDVEKQTGERLKALDMRVVEEEPRSGYPGDRDPFGERILVTPDPPNTWPSNA